jgi:hypothetical protein
MAAAAADIGDWPAQWLLTPGQSKIAHIGLDQNCIGRLAEYYTP